MCPGGVGSRGVWVGFVNDVMVARSRRRRLRLLGVALVLVLASCAHSGGGGSSTTGAPDAGGHVSLVDSVPGTTAATPPASASASSDTAAPESSAPDTADPGTGSLASWSVVASDAAFQPACVDRSPEAGAATADDDPALDTLQPLGAEPVVQVELPRVVGGRGGNDWIRAGVQRIPGGMLLALRPHDSWANAPGVLVAVDADGSVRWQRCLLPMPEVVLVSDRGRPSEFVLARSVYDATGLVDTHLEVWSLADGRRARSWDEQLRAEAITGPAAAHRLIIWWGERSLLVLGAGGPRPVAPSDAVLVVDLETMAMRTVAYPPTELGLPLDSVRFGVTDDVRLTTLGVDDSTGREFVRAVEVPGGWSTDAAALAAATGPDVRFAWEVTDQPLVGVDAQGVERWRRDDVLAIRAEGFMVEVVGNWRWRRPVRSPRPATTSARARSCWRST